MHENSENHSLIKQIDKWSGWLTALVVIIPFIVSYGSLKDLAAANGVNYPFMYPLMIDLSLIIFNLIALRSSLHGERNLYAWTLVVIATFISVVLNVVHAPRGVLPMFMAALPPMFILAAFHLVVLRIEHSAQRHQVVNTLSHLVKRIKEARAEHEQLTRQNEALRQEAKTRDEQLVQSNDELSRLQNEQLAPVHEQIAQANHELSQLQNEQLATVHEQIVKAQHELSRLQREQSTMKQQITAMKQDEQNQINHEQAVEQSELERMNQRRERLLALLKDSDGKITQGEIAELLGVSLSTIRRDLQALNGQVTG